jgi:DNA-binding Lrp family transcriptional regulator
VRKLRNFKGVLNVFEVTGDHDVTVVVKVESVPELNRVVEEIRSIDGVRETSTKIVLKRYRGNHANEEEAEHVAH